MRFAVFISQQTFNHPLTDTLHLSRDRTSPAALTVTLGFRSTSPTQTLHRAAYLIRWDQSDGAE